MNFVTKRPDQHLLEFHISVGTAVVKIEGIPHFSISERGISLFRIDEDQQIPGLKYTDQNTLSVQNAFIS